jgi:hypothetical protein
VQEEREKIEAGYAVEAIRLNDVQSEGDTTLKRTDSNILIPDNSAGQGFNSILKSARIASWNRSSSEI